MIKKNADNRDKWIARFVCIVIACCLWLYVMSEQNPVVEKDFVVPLAQRNLPDGMIVFNMPEKVSVRVRAPRTVLATLPSGEIYAYVNLDKLPAGPHTALITARFYKGDVVQVSPSAANLLVDVKKEKIVPVKAEIVGAPNKDYAIEEHILTPSEVKITGAGTRLDVLERVFVPVDVSNRSEEFTVAQKPLAVAKGGMDMQDVTIDPNEIIVRTRLIERAQMKTVPVKVSYKGVLKENLKITSSTVNPFKVAVTGKPSVIEKLADLELEPVDLNKVTGDVSLKTKIIFPEGISGTRKTVDVDITVDNSEDAKD